MAGSRLRLQSLRERSGHEWNHEGKLLTHYAWVSVALSSFPLNSTATWNPVVMGFSFVATRMMAMKATGHVVESATGGTGLE